MLIASLLILVITLVTLVWQSRLSVTSKNNNQIGVLPVWTDDPINDRFEIFVSKEFYETQE